MEAQEHKVRAMASIKDAVLAEVIEDEDESGKSLDRPGVQRLLALVKSRSVDMVIFAKLDRISRSVRDIAAIVDLFNKKKVALISVSETIDTTTANGRMFVYFMGLMGQMEREVIGERTSAALQQKRRRGERAGTVPYGFRAVEGGKLEAEPSEADVVATAKVLRESGLSLRKVADSLNEDGYKTRAGTPWRFQYVARILGVK